MKEFAFLIIGVSIGYAICSARNRSKRLEEQLAVIAAAHRNKPE